MSKCTVHTVRFYVPEVRAIHCMARSFSAPKIAVARSDGSIEIWNIKTFPHLEHVLFADSVESLAWSQKRLFSAGLHGTVLEFDMNELNIKQALPMVGGPVWCIAVGNKERMLAAGTEEGYVNILHISRDGLETVKLLNKQVGRVLCLAWHPDGQQILTGSTDSLRLWNVDTGRVSHRMTVPRQTNNEETTVWCVAVTKDGQGVAGDSRGVLSFWDLETAVLSQEVETHTAPVLALTMNDKKIFCSGTDPIVAVLRRDPMEGQWVHTASRRIHDHDVRALVVHNTELYSGGIDGHIGVSTSLPNRTYKCPPMHHDAVMLTKNRLLLLRHVRHVEVWALGKKQPGHDSNGDSGSSDLKHLLTLQSQHAEHIVNAAISANGNYVAYSTPTTTRLVELSLSGDSVAVTGSWRVPIQGGAIVLAFCPATHRLGVATRSWHLKMFKVDAESKLTIQFDVHVNREIKGPMRLLSFTDDGEHIVIGGICGHVLAYRTFDERRVLKIMKKGCDVTAIGYREGALMIAYSDFKLSEWSFETQLNTDFGTSDLDYFQGIAKKSCLTKAAWNEENPEQLLLADRYSIYGFTWKEEDEPTEGKRVRDGQREKKRYTKNVVTLATYQNLVFADWLGPNELVVVETPSAALERHLPPVLRKARFGTK